MNATKIEYLDFTWSVLVGCSQVGCAVAAKCWAMYQAKRRKQKCLDCYTFTPHSHLYRGNQPAQRKKPSKIGVCFSADMWDKGFSRVQQQMVLDFAKAAPWHRFINLTKQTQNIPKDIVFPENWIQGASICRQADLYRVKDLMQLKVKATVLSIEPLYEALPKLDLQAVSWVIIGGQTHPLKLPKKEWVDEIILKAKAHNTPVFTKNNLNSLGYNLKEYPTIFSVG